MTNLRELTLDIDNEKGKKLLDGTAIKPILIHMPQLQTFNFHFITEIKMQYSDIK